MIDEALSQTALCVEEPILAMWDKEKCSSP